MIISKELLSEVLDKNVLSIERIVVNNYNTQLHFTTFGFRQNEKNKINIYELGHKCKEKAREYGYSITTGNRVDGTDRYDVICIHKDEDIENDEAVYLNEISDNEPIGAINAMQWILDNKSIP